MLSVSLDISEKCEKQVYACAISTDGVVAAGVADGSTILIKPDGRAVLHNHRYPVIAVCFTKNYLITASSDHSIVFWDIQSGTVKEKLMHHKGPVRCLSVSKDGSLLISGSSDQTICITNIVTKPQVIRHLQQPESDAGMLSGLCISDDNSIIISTATSGTLFVYDTNLVKAKHCLYDTHEMGVNGCDIKQREGTHLLCTVGADYLVKLWDVENYSLVLHQTLSGHTGQVLCSKFHVLMDGTDALFTGSVDKTVIIWDVSTGDKLHQAICHSSFVYSIALHEDKLVTCSSDKTVKQWTVCLGKVRTINVIPIAHQDKLTDWSNRQVVNWLQRVLPSSTTTLTGKEVAEQELDVLTATLASGSSAEVKSKLLRSVMLLRSFDGAPPEFLCPISMEIMTDPVVTTDGHSYERSNITEWLAAGHNTSPFTNTTLSTHSLVTNHNLRKIIQTAFLIE